MTYLLTNSGSIVLNWKATPTVSWVSVVPPSGSIMPLKNQIMSVTTNSQANSLSPGTYSGLLNIQNITPGPGSSTKTITLTVTTTGSAILAVDPNVNVTFTGKQGGPFS